MNMNITVQVYVHQEPKRCDVVDRVLTSVAGWSTPNPNACEICSDSRTRTLDPAVNSRLLYQLS